MNDNLKAVEVQSVSNIFEGPTNGVHALEDITFEIRMGEFVSIIGPSGCGKSTLLRLISNLETPTSGTIKVAGKTPNQARLNRDFACVFQSPALLEWRSTLQNVMLPLEILGVDKGRMCEKAQELIIPILLHYLTNWYIQTR